MEFISDLQTLSWQEAVFRLGLACIFGFVLGFDRSRDGGFSGTYGAGSLCRDSKARRCVTT